MTTLKDYDEIDQRKAEAEYRQRQTPELNTAFAAARAEIHNPAFDSTNPHFRSKFASLKAVINATLPIAAKHGIAVPQDVRTLEDRVECYTYLCHESGEERCYGPFAVRIGKQDAHGIASASTYARRYHLMFVFGVAGDEDDDGNTAVENTPEMPEKHARQLADLLDAADPETGEGLESFAEAWLELNSDEQLGFAPHLRNFYPNAVTKAKAKMHAVMRAWRENQSSEA